jgi:hypothetical protein
MQEAQPASFLPLQLVSLSYLLGSDAQGQQRQSWRLLCTQIEGAAAGEDCPGLTSATKGLSRSFGGLRKRIPFACVNLGLLIFVSGLRRFLIWSK